MEVNMQVGAVIVFKEGVTKAEAEATLKRFEDLLDPIYADKIPGKSGVLEEHYARYAVRVEEFDPAYGYPVFYIP